MILDMNKQDKQEDDSISVKQSNTVSTMVDHDFEAIESDDKSLVFLE